MGKTLGDTISPQSINISRWWTERSRRGLRHWSANSIKNSYHQLGLREVRNPPRVIQQVYGRIWVRIEVCQSCSYYVLGTVLSGPHIVNVSRYCPNPHFTDESFYPGATFLPSKQRWRWKWEELAEPGDCCPQPQCREEGGPPSPKRHPHGVRTCPFSQWRESSAWCIPPRKAPFTEMIPLPGFHSWWNLPEGVRDAAQNYWRFAGEEEI